MQKFVIAFYIRLSLEDTKTESMSIPNQRAILREHAMSLAEWDRAEVLEFVDNGHSGANFERPAVQELLEMVQAGKIDCIMVKDLSRFGRNSIETGYFIERVFPLYHTRFISVSDDFDTINLKGDTGGIDVAFKYLISECYSRDMSVKTKTAKYAKMQRGEYQSKICPYGYRKSADGRMEIDENVAEIVRLPREPQRRRLPGSCSGGISPHLENTARARDRASMMYRGRMEHGAVQPSCVCWRMNAISAPMS